MWYSFVRFGLGWEGCPPLVRYGMIWYGIPYKWYSLVWFGMGRLSAPGHACFSSSVWSLRAIGHGPAQIHSLRPPTFVCMVSYGLVWFATVFYKVVCFGKGLWDKCGILCPTLLESQCNGPALKHPLTLSSNKKYWRRLRFKKRLTPALIKNIDACSELKRLMPAPIWKDSHRLHIQKLNNEADKDGAVWIFCVSDSKQAPSGSWSSLFYHTLTMTQNTKCFHGPESSSCFSIHPSQV